MNKKIITKLTSGALLCTMLTYTSPILAYTKDETVYTKIDVTGKSYSTIVNSHIKNNNRENSINDLSNLINIKNVNGDEKFTQSGNSLVWNADGSDIYYQGESESELPIECNVRYELDGKEISPKELAGKSGKVKMIIEYINKDAHTVNIHSKDEILYTPFVVVCGTILDNTNFRNIEVSNGKVIDDGTKTFVIGMAFPGLKESLNLEDDKIKIPNTVEITMEAESFETSTMASFVTPKILEESDLSIFDDLDDMYSQVNTLESSSKQLEDGATTLKDGATTFFEKSKEFNDAMKQVSSGASSAYEGYLALDDGINALNNSSPDLVDGARKLHNGAIAMKNGLNTVNTNFKTIADGTEALSDGLADAVKQVNALVSDGSGSKATSIDDELAELMETTETKLTGVVTDSNTALGTEKYKLNVQLQNLNAQITKIKSENPDWESDTDVQAELAPLIASATIIQSSMKSIDDSMDANLDFATNLGSTLQTTAGGIKNKLATYQTALTKLPGMISNLEFAATSAKQISDGTKQLKSGIATLASSSKELADGTNSLYDGTITLADGTKALAEGSKDMKDGLKTLSSGTNELSDANDMLTDGASTLSNGAETLANGMKQFNREGIQKICDLVNDDVKDLTVKLEKLQDLANEYQNFTMLDNNSDGTVKFVILMDGVKE